MRGRYSSSFLVDPSLKMASVGGASLLTIAAEGPVNDYFYIDTGEAKPSSNRTGSLQAAKEVKDLIDRGNSREEIGNRISVTTGA